MAYTNINNCYTCSDVPKKCSTGCIQIVPGSCVKYTGPFLANTDIRFGDTMDAAFQKISVAIGQAGSGSNLQKVTDVGNVTTNSIFITGANKFPTTGQGLAFASAGGQSVIYSMDAATTQTLQLLFYARSLQVTLDGPNPDTSYISSTHKLSLRGNGVELISDDILKFKVQSSSPSTDYAMFYSNSGPIRVKGAEAINPDEFITLSQLSVIEADFTNSYFDI